MRIWISGEKRRRRRSRLPVYADAMHPATNQCSSTHHTQQQTPYQTADRDNGFQH
ncbi:hypothetical protein ACNKHK_22040 [Shigella flexneri]